MDRRVFLQCAGVAAAAVDPAIPKYRIVSKYQRGPGGMPGAYRGQAVTVHCERAIDVQSEKVDAAAVRQMIARGMTALTGDRDSRDSWARFFDAHDVVGIKVNCSGAPGIMSTREVVADIVQNLLTVGVKASQIWVYERFADQMRDANYGPLLPQGVHIEAAERDRGAIARYDPATYVDVEFFGEEDTRSNLVRLVSQTFTKIINVPNMKDHGAAGVTGCLKNIAYGNFSNVARSHRNEKTNTYSFIGTLATVEPVRTRTVLNIMDGLRGVWHAGPFSFKRKFRFYPKQIMFGTDPVAMDRLLIDVIDAKRKAEGATSVWDRSRDRVKRGEGYSDDPNIQRFIREPGHIEYAAGLGLGEYDILKIHHKKIEL